MRIAAFLSVRRVASSSDESLMDLTLKVSVTQRCNTPSFLYKTPSEHIPDIRAGLQINHPTYLTVHQFDEEHSERTVYHEPRYSVSTCIRVHPSTGYSLEERPQSEEQGLSLDQMHDAFSFDTAYRRFTNKYITGNSSIVSIFGPSSLQGRATG